jgi:hypothetical protein
MQQILGTSFAKLNISVMKVTARVKHTYTQGEKYEQNTLRDPSRTLDPGQRNPSSANLRKTQSTK